MSASGGNVQVDEAQLSTRLVCHECDETIHGHVFCTYVTPVLRRALENGIAAASVTEGWSKVLAAVARCTYVDIEKDGTRFRIRSTTHNCAGWVVQSVWIAVPPTVPQIQAENVT